ncbi:MAG: O-antigen ligase family protein [Bacteroidales bacterium]
MTKKLEKTLIVGGCIIFALINCLLITKNIYWGLTLPLVIAAATLYIFAMDKVLLLISFLTPLAIEYDNIGFGIGLSLPTEPMLIVVMIIFILRLLYDIHLDRNIIKHPIFISVIFYLFWMLITSITSEIPIVSFKYLISQSWFILPFYIFGTLLFKEEKNIFSFIRLYIYGLSLVIIYTVIHHAINGFTEQAGHWVMTPFYNDHTAYGAALAFFFPAVIYFAFNKGFSFKSRFIHCAIFGIFIIAIVLSYGRAAWISILGSFCVAGAIWLRIKFKYILAGVIIVFGLFFSFQHQIIDYLEKNKQNSSANFVEHIRSISNISSDASNLERINRWQSAIRLFKARPVFGWGPGTYQFVYSPFQMSREKTIISTNSGDQGSAHSEYLGPLADRGVLGLISILLIIIFGLYKGIKLYTKTEDKTTKGLIMICVLGIVAYSVNGILNSFLETDKLAIPFWGYLAIITSLDLRHNNRKKIV